MRLGPLPQLPACVSAPRKQQKNGTHPHFRLLAGQHCALPAAAHCTPHPPRQPLSCAVSSAELRPRSCTNFSSAIEPCFRHTFPVHTCRLRCLLLLLLLLLLHTTGIFLSLHACMVAAAASRVGRAWACASADSSPCRVGVRGRTCQPGRPAARLPPSWVHQDHGGAAGTGGSCFGHKTGRWCVGRPGFRGCSWGNCNEGGNLEPETVAMINLKERERETATDRGSNAHLSVRRGRASLKRGSTRCV
jgi:hypothetical protein